MFFVRRIVLSSLILFLPLGLNAAERSIGISFTGGSNATGGNPTSLETGDSAGVVAKSNWNNAAGNNGTIRSLNDDSGRASGASAKWESYGTWSLNIAPISGNNKLMKGYLDTGNDTTTAVSVTNLPADIVAAGYDVYVYCDGENSATGGSNTRYGKYSIGSTTIVVGDLGGSDFGGTFTESRGDKATGNYIRFNGLKEAQFTLNATPDPSDTGATKRAPINGIQIVSPSTGAAKVAAAATSTAPAAAAAAWTSRDIGGAMAGSTAALGADGLEIKGSGNDFWDKRDSFRYVYQVCKGDFEISVRVRSQEKTDEWAKAGLMIRQSAAEDAMHVSLVVSPDHGCHIQRRMGTGNESQDSDAGLAAVPNCWLRMVRKGNTFTCSISGDGQSWRESGSIEISFPETVLAGLAVCSHAGDKISRAEFRNFALKTQAGSFTAALLEAAAKPDAPETAVKERPVESEPSRRPAASRPTEYSPADRTLAAGLAAGAAKLAADGKDEKARDMCFKALANDENCAEALYELGKLLEKSGERTFAADFLARASRELARMEGPANSTKKQDADRRLVKLNPYNARLTAIYSDYSTDLSATVKKSSESFTQEEAADRISKLRLAEFVAPEKLPKLDKVAVAAPPKTPNSSGPGPSSFGPRRPPAAAVNDVPVEVERALKTAGWTKITGTWKKKADNVYEVTDGKLEAPIVNGALQVIVQKGGTGSVRAMVRDSNAKDRDGFYFSYGSGYGVRMEENTAKLYIPYNYSGLLYRPSMDREVGIAEGLPKAQLLITVNEGNLEITVNNKREHRSNYKITKDGPFVIEVEGTMTIESPQAKGQ